MPFNHFLCCDCIGWLADTHTHTDTLYAFETLLLKTFLVK